MNWLAMTVMEKTAKVTQAADATGAAVSSEQSVEQVAENVIETVAEDIESVQEQTNFLIKYLIDHIPNIISFGINILIAIIIFFVGKKIINIVRKIVKRSLTKANADVGVMQFLDALVKAVLYFILIVIIVGRFGIEASSLMAIVGSAGLAVGLALQGSLSNFAGGVLILLLKPFKVGDYIIAAEEGTVVGIHIFYTKLVTADNKLIYIPNGTLSNSNIINVTSQDIRRVDISVGISYNSDLKLAKKVLYELAANYKNILGEKEIDIFVNELAASEVNLGLRFWVKTEDYWDAKWALTEEIKLKFDEMGIEIPYNQLDVHVTQ